MREAKCSLSATMSSPATWQLRKSQRQKVPPPKGPSTAPVLMSKRRQGIGLPVDTVVRRGSMDVLKGESQQPSPPTAPPPVVYKELQTLAAEREWLSKLHDETRSHVQGLQTLAAQRERLSKLHDETRSYVQELTRLMRSSGNPDVSQDLLDNLRFCLEDLRGMLAKCSPDNEPPLSQGMHAYESLVASATPPPPPPPSRAPPSTALLNPLGGRLLAARAGVLPEPVLAEADDDGELEQSDSQLRSNTTAQSREPAVRSQSQMKEPCMLLPAPQTLQPCASAPVFSTPVLCRRGSAIAPTPPRKGIHPGHQSSRSLTTTPSTASSHVAPAGRSPVTSTTSSSRPLPTNVVAKGCNNNLSMLRSGSPPRSARRVNSSRSLTPSGSQISLHDPRTQRYGRSISVTRCHCHYKHQLVLDRLERVEVLVPE
mmetsp:Transcript_31330/g.71530  ORF Transcript_31330/g.71530 Transcript_31330/m.71530 type:complete len:427 (+) Transcript_31330:129-1409(+)